MLTGRTISSPVPTLAAGTGSLPGYRSGDHLGAAGWDFQFLLGAVLGRQPLATQCHRRAASAVKLKGNETAGCDHLNLFPGLVLHGFPTQRPQVFAMFGQRLNGFFNAIG